MAVDEHQRERLRAQARDLRAVECDEELGTDAARRAIEVANRHRRADGRPSLRESESPPEAELYARARALGLRRIGR